MHRYCNRCRCSRPHKIRRMAVGATHSTYKHKGRKGVQPDTLIYANVRYCVACMKTEIVSDRVAATA